jgi:hypothetical protein
MVDEEQVLLPVVDEALFERQEKQVVAEPHRARQEDPLVVQHNVAQSARRPARDDDPVACRMRSRGETGGGSSARACLFSRVMALFQSGDVLVSE